MPESASPLEVSQSASTPLQVHGVECYTFQRILLGLAVLIELIVAASCSVTVSEQKILHPRPAGAVSQASITKAAPAFTLTQVEITRPDGVRLRAIRLRQPGAHLTVLYFGGRLYTVGKSAATTASRFAPLGVDLFIPDYRGYGQSEGTPDSSSIAADALAIFDYVASLPDVGAERLVVHGHSMGSFAAGYVSAHRPAAGVVLESSATTTEEWVQARLPRYARPFIRPKIADDLKGRGNGPNMPLIEGRLLILVGAHDKTTPSQLSEGLYAESPLPESRKSLLIVHGAGHGNVMTHADALEAYRRFLAAISAERVD